MFKAKPLKELPATSTNSLLERKCLQSGVRITVAKRSIFNILEQSKRPLTAEDIYRYSLSSDANFSLSTIYNNIRFLVNAGIIQRSNFQSKQNYYIAKKSKPKDQIIDIESGEVIEFSNKSLDKLKAEMAQEYGFNIEGCRMELYVQVTKNLNSDKQI